MSRRLLLRKHQEIKLNYISILLFHEDHCRYIEGLDLGGYR